MGTESETFGYREIKPESGTFGNGGILKPKAELSGTVALLHFEILIF